MELRRANYSLDRLIDATSDPDQRAELRRRRRENELRYNLLVERSRVGGTLAARRARPPQSISAASRDATGRLRAVSSTRTGAGT